VLNGICTRSDNEIRTTERGTARPAQRLPNFNAVRKDDRSKFSAAPFHEPKDGRQMRVKRNYQRRFAPGRAQGGKDKLQLASGVT
jgi:hypothetical protein